MQTAKKAIPHVIFLIISCVSMAQCSFCRADEVVDHGIFAELLLKHVKNGVVDYRGFKNCEVRLDAYLLVLENTDTKVLSRNERFAFYINAYNAWTIKLILGKYPGVKSIKGLGSVFQSPWKKKICRIDGDVLTLDYLEHQILRPVFKDPRVHFAVNCASKSCPPLPSEPYSGLCLDRQLEAVTTGFINDPDHNYLRGDTLYVSKIFEWFPGDFNGEIIEFFLKHARGDLKEKLEANKGNITVKYLAYDWSLNGS
jgi:hypothetical protein